MEFVCTDRWVTVDSVVISVYCVLLLLTSGFTGWAVVLGRAPETEQQWVVSLLILPWVGLGLNALVIALASGAVYGVLRCHMYFESGW